MTYKKQYTQPVDLQQFCDLLREFYLSDAEPEEDYETYKFRIRNSKKQEGAFVLWMTQESELYNPEVYQVARFEVNDKRLLRYFTYLRRFRSDSLHEINTEVKALERDFPVLRRQRRLAHLLRADRAQLLVGV